MFPEIREIGDILPYIRDKDEFRVHDKRDYIVMDYVVHKEDTFDSPQAMEARGHKYWPDGTIAARLLHKFFNLGERRDLEDQYFTNSFRWFEKADGSLVHFLPIGGQLRAMTKAGITEVSELCEREVEFHPDFWSALQDILDCGLTPIFEFTSPNNRIVIPYKKPELTLIAVRDNVTGEYQPLDDYAAVLHVPRVKEYTDITLGDVREWVDREGVVLVWDSGYRVKCKADDYLLKHKTKDQLSQEKNVLEFVIDDKVDDLAGILDSDDFNRVKVYKNGVLDRIQEKALMIHGLVDDLSHLERRDVAKFVTQNLEKPEQSCFWQAYGGKDPRVAICELVKKNLTSQTRIDNIRCIVGEKWEDY